MSHFINKKIEYLLRKIDQLYSQKILSNNHSLWSELKIYLQKTKSTGCGYIDYAALYHEVRSRKPLNVLECGTGVSTLIIAHAMQENEKESGIHGCVTSMEEYEEYLQMSRQLLPVQYQGYVDFRCSDTVEDRFSIFRGVRYREIPVKPYDYVFVDGPKYHSPIDDTPTFDYDYLYVLRNTINPVAALIDKRVSTVFVLQQILGNEKVKYQAIKGLGFVSPCTKQDLGDLSVDLSSLNFTSSFSLFGSTTLSLSPLKGNK